MSGPRRQPDFLRLPRGLAEHPAVMERHDRVVESVQDEDRHRRDLPYPFLGAVVVVDRPGQGILERPGEPETAQFLPGDAAKAREGAVDDQCPYAVLVPGTGDGVGRDRAAQALTKHHDTIRVRFRHAHEFLEGRIGVAVNAFERRLPAGPPVSAVVNNKEVVAFLHEPQDAVHVRAQVLGVAVQDEDAAEGVLRREVPAVDRDPVRRGEHDIAVVEQLHCGPFLHVPGGMKKERAAARGRKQEAKENKSIEYSHSRTNAPWTDEI